jgi:uncharacterized protein YkwD
MNTRGLGAVRPHAARTATQLLVSTLSAALVTAGLAATAVTGPRSVEIAAPVTTDLVTTSSMSMTSDTYEQRVQRLVNRRRAARGLPRLRLASCPEGTAQDWSRTLAVSGEFYHQTMGSVLETCDAAYAGETLGRGSMGPRRLVRMWMESSSHRSVLLSTKSRRIGVGATPDRYGRWVVAANFVRF